MPGHRQTADQMTLICSDSEKGTLEDIGEIRSPGERNYGDIMREQYRIFDLGSG